MESAWYGFSFFLFGISQPKKKKKAPEIPYTVETRGVERWVERQMDGRKQQAARRCRQSASGELGSTWKCRLVLVLGPVCSYCVQPSSVFSHSCCCKGVIEGKVLKRCRIKGCPCFTENQTLYNWLSGRPSVIKH